MKGRKPKPTHLKVITGNPGKRPINAREPKPTRGALRCPPDLTDAARKAWEQIAPELAAMGVLTTADTAALRQLCEAVSDFQAAREVLKTSGRFYETRTPSGAVMHRAHPAVALAADADRRLRGWLSEFGLTPSARTRVHGAPAEAPSEEDRFFS